MTQRMACPPVPGPLEDYALQFDDLFRSVAQRRGFRTYLQGLLPRERNKTLTGLIGTEPVVGAQAATCPAVATGQGVRENRAQGEGRQVIGMTPDREVCRVQNAETILSELFIIT
jgi:hypothetical protein